jgi:hypothetical protein
MEKEMSKQFDLAFDHTFRKKAGRILESGQSRSIILSGNVQDLFYLTPEFAGDKSPNGKYVPLTSYLSARWGRVKDTILIVYELNGPIRFMNNDERELLKNAWPRTETLNEEPEWNLRTLVNHAKDQIAGARKKTDPFDDYMQRAIGRPAVALQLLRKFCQLSREAEPGSPLFGKQLLILVEWADMILPEGEISRLSEVDRERIMVCQDWFSDPDFLEGEDSVVLISESRSMINNRVSQMPQILEVAIPSPDDATRDHFISWFENGQKKKLKLWGTQQNLVSFSAGLSLHAMRQMLIGSIHDENGLIPADVIRAVETYIKSQLGEDAVEFKVPIHSMNDVIGYTSLKRFIETEVVPRFISTGDDALSGAIVAGPIGSGKTFIWEAVASILGIPVLVLKNLRSQWYGQTDVILERLIRILMSLSKVMIFVDEADTVFGGVGKDVHETERRLTGKIQGCMSDTRLKGKVIWLLITARVYLLSPDMRREGRGGSLIVPILDPEGDDRDSFITWMLKRVMSEVPANNSEDFQRIRAATMGYSSGAFSSLRSELVALAKGSQLTIEQVLARVHDQLQPDIGLTRKYQTLQAMLNTTRRCLLHDPKVTEEQRKAWYDEIRALEAQGIH